MCYKTLIRRVILIVILAVGLVCLSGCSEKKEVRQDIAYELCSEEKLPDELMKLIEDKKSDSFAFSYSTNDYTYIAVGYGMHDRDGYVVCLKDIFVTDYACYVQCAILTQEYVDSLEGVYICSTPSMSPYLVIRCKRLSIPVMFSY